MPTKGLNVNRGSKILLRLRPHQTPDTFYEQDQLVLVMLHEVSPRRYQQERKAHVVHFRP